MTVGNTITTTPDATALTPAERCKLENLEHRIEKHKPGMIVIAKSLSQIRGERLYRESHGTFEEYARDRWNFGKSHAYRMIAYAKNQTIVSPGGDEIGEPVSRELSRLPEGERRQCYEEAVAAATGNKVDAAFVRIYVEKRLNTVDAVSVAPSEDDPNQIVLGKETFELGSGRTSFDDDKAEKAPTWTPQERSNDKAANDMIDTHRVAVERIVNACPIEHRQRCYEAAQTHVAGMYGAWFANAEVIEQ